MFFNFVRHNMFLLGFGFEPKNLFLALVLKCLLLHLFCWENLSYR
jgi:hypothetical protein